MDRYVIKSIVPWSLVYAIYAIPGAYSITYRISKPDLKFFLYSILSNLLQKLTIPVANRSYL